MSTKLYNGIKFKAKSLREVQGLLMGMRKDAAKLVVEDFKCCLSEFGWVLWGDSNVKSDVPYLWRFTNYRYAARDIIPRATRPTGYLMDPYALLEVAVLPDENGDLYGYVIGEGKAANFVMSHPEVEDYHYQTQCDPPEDIPYKEFEARGKKWGLLTRDKWRWDECAFIFNLAAGYEFDQLMKQAVKDVFEREWEKYIDKVHSFDGTIYPDDEKRTRGGNGV